MEEMTHNEDSLLKVRAHLTEDELDDVLMELAEPAVLQHAESCAECSLRVAEFRESMASFNQATLAWSEARSNSLPPETVNAQGRGWLLGNVRWNHRWTYAGGALAGLAMLLAGAVHDRAAAPGDQQASAPGADYYSARQQEISNDNAMLSAISAELYQPVAIPDSLSDEVSSERRGAGRLRQARD